MTSVAAMAACGGAPNLVALSSVVGPPSITATETSTDQALELVRRRREEAGGACPAGFVRSGGNCVPAGQAAPPPPQVAAAPPPPAAAPPPAPQVATTTTTGPAPAAPAAAAAAAKRPVPRVAAKAAPRAKAPPAAPGVAAAPPPPRVAVAPRRAPQQVAVAAPPPAAPAPTMGYGGSIKDSGYQIPIPGTVRATGVWLEGYYDYERHTNMNPGQGSNNPTRRTVTGGMLAGVDVSQFTTGPMVRGHQIGFFSGHNMTRAKLTDTVSSRLQDNNTHERTLSTAQRQETDGAFAGVYASMVHGGFSADVTFKVDFFQYETSSVDFLLDCAANTPVNKFGTTTMTNYMVASNWNYRFALSQNHYIEPTVGVRYTVTDFGGNARQASVKDGEAFRVQGGLRLGSRYTTPDGWVWHTALAGLLYSDVSISGYRINTGSIFDPAFPLVDENKLRVMGILENRVEIGRGYTLYGDLEVRGGQDVFGFGSRVGIRYQW